MTVNYPLNTIVCTAHLAMNAFVLFVFPMAFTPHPGLAVWAVFAVSCTSNGLFSVLHEAIHRSLAPVQRLPLVGMSANELLGRAVGICFGSPFDFVASAHITHHNVNRSRHEQLEILADPITPKERRSFLAGYYFFLMGGLYEAELFIPLMLWLPRSTARALLARLFPAGSTADHALRRIFRSRRYLRAIRIDGLLIVASIGTSVVLYERYAWILAIHFAVRALLISFFDYAYHYGSPTDDRLHGFNLRLPRALSSTILNFNYHGIHHRYPALPWRGLRPVFEAESLVFDNQFFAQAVSQLKGPMTRAALDKLVERGRCARRGSEIHCDEQVDRLGVEMSAGNRTKVRSHSALIPALPIGTVRPQGVPHVYDGEQPGSERNGFTP